MSAAPPRRVLANLDVEAGLAGEALPRRVLLRLSAAGTLLRVFAGEGDVLHTPLAVDPRRVLPVDGLAAPALELLGRRPAPDGREVWWCAPASQRLLPRDVGHGLACELGLALPGACIVSSPSELLERLRGPAFGAARRWVLKPRLSAAGRGQVRGRGEQLDDGSAAAGSDAVRRLLAGGALLEPWLDRLADFGCAAEVDEEGRVALVGVHGMLVDEAGRFRGIELRVGPAPPPGLHEAERARLEDVARRAGAGLAARGLRGPFGIDAFRHRASGGAAFHALAELNARMTFGRVARALVDALAPRHLWRPDDVVRLRFGRGTVRPVVGAPSGPAGAAKEPAGAPGGPAGAAKEPAGAPCRSTAASRPRDASRLLALLAPDPAGGDDTCAWIEREPAERDRV